MVWATVLGALAGAVAGGIAVLSFVVSWVGRNEHRITAMEINSQQNWKRVDDHEHRIRALESGQ